MARTTIPAELVAINAIQGTLIADNSVTAVHIATNAISGTLVADNSITSTHIAQNQVTATQIAQNTITVGQIADSAVETAKLNNDAVTQAKIADDAVGADQLAANSVVSASIVNGTIVEADMADNAVTLAKMASLARGSIIVGDSAGDPSALSIGSNTYVLTSDGTDISWAAASGGVAGISSSADATAITIDSSEKVGIRDTTPDAVLKVNSTGGGSELAFKVADASDNMVFEVQGGGRAHFNYGPVLIGSTTDIMHANMDDLQVGHTSGSKGITIASGSDSYGTLAFGDGSSGNEAYRGFVEYFHNEDSMRLGTAGSERMRIDSSGRVLLGVHNTNGTNFEHGGVAQITVNPSSWSSGLGIGTQSNVSEGDGCGIDFFQKISLSGAKWNTARIGSHAVSIGSSAYGDIRFSTMNATTLSERMRIDSSGDIRFGHTGAYIATDEVYTFYNQQKGRTVSIATAGNASHYGIDMWNQVGGSCNQILFRGGGSGATTGTITSTGNNATQYNTSSDYRLKENVDYTWDATTRLKQLKPVRFNWISDDTNTLEDGFLAHEVSSIVPNAVTGEKDAVYTEAEAASEIYIDTGDIKRQQLDHSKLVPLLVKTIQELEARIATLEG